MAARAPGIAYRADGGWPRVRRLRADLGRRVSAERADGHGLAVATVAIAMVGLPVLKPAGPVNSAPIDFLVLVAVGATLLWLGTASAPIRLPYGGAMAVFVFAGALASLLGRYPEIGLAALVQDLVVLAWCAAIVNVARTPAALRTVLRAWAWSSIAWAVVLLAAYFTGHKEISGVTAAEGPRASLTLNDPNLAASYFVLSFFVVLAAREPRNRWLRYAGCAALLGGLAVTFSSGGIACLVLGGAILVVSAIARRNRVLAILAAMMAAVVVIGGIYLLLNAPQVQQALRTSNVTLVRQSIGRSAHSVQERTSLLDQATSLYLTAAPIGIGANAYRSSLYQAQAAYVHEAHDDYVAALVERGLLGMLGMVLLVGAVATRGWSIVREPLAGAYRTVVPNPTALVAAAAAVALSGIFYQVLHFRHVWAVLALIAAVYQWGRSRSE